MPSLPAATDLTLVDRPGSGPNALNLTLVTPPEDRPTIPVDPFSSERLSADAAGNEAVCDPVVTDLPAALPAVTALNATYPNPACASSSVTVPFSLAGSTGIHVVVYDVLGREVAVLANEVMDAGSYEVAWPEAASLPAGTYLVRMTAGEVVQTKRLTLVR